HPCSTLFPYTTLFRSVLFGVFEKNLYRLDAHRAVAIERNAWDLPCLHQLLKDEQELLGSLHRKSWDDDAAAALDRFTNQRRQFGDRKSTRLNSSHVSI